MFEKRLNGTWCFENAFKPLIKIGVYNRKSHLASRMMICQNLTLSVWVDMKIYLRGCDGTVPKNVLDIGNIDVFFKKKGGKRVAKRMWCNMLFNMAIMCQTVY